MSSPLVKLIFSNPVCVNACPIIVLVIYLACNSYDRHNGSSMQYLLCFQRKLSTILLPEIQPDRLPRVDSFVQSRDSMQVHTNCGDRNPALPSDNMWDATTFKEFLKYDESSNCEIRSKFTTNKTPTDLRDTTKRGMI